MSYTVRDELKPAGLSGFSDNQIDQHWNLYKGYVKNTNGLLEELASLRADKGGSALYADRRRRFGFEYNGMVLHEYYFGGLSQGGSTSDGALKKAIQEAWGSCEAWTEDFKKTGATRSIGWAILYGDPTTGQLFNQFIQVHEDGHPAGFAPIVVMDVWEHAYMVDWGAGGRGTYMDHLLNNICWQKAEKRFADLQGGVIHKRF